jgi:ankyrin repeat protein
MFKISGVAVLLVAVLNQSAFGQEVTSVADELIPSHLLEHVLGGNFEGITSALEVNGEDINLQNNNGWSAARFAVSNGDFDMTKFLIGKEIDLNNPDNEGVTPLMVAAAQVSCFLTMIVLSF